MADETVTAADVVIQSGSMGQGTAGASITQGMPIYEDAGDSNKLKPADNSSAAKANVRGIALNAAENGQPVLYVKSGEYDPGFTPTAGTVYVVSSNAGKICAMADLASTNYVTVIGVGKDANTLTMGPIVTGAQVP